MIESNSIELDQNLQISIQTFLKFLIYFSVFCIIVGLFVIYIVKKNIYLLIVAQPYLLSFIYLLMYKISLKKILLQIF